MPSPSLQREAPQTLVIPCGRRRLIYRGRPLVMGILNVTPDSFSDGGAFLDPSAAVERGVELAAEGADIIDVGGESTRPGAQSVSCREELQRTIPVVERLLRMVRIPVSIDTTKAEVARRAIEVGASLVNDVSALRADRGMAGLVARSQVAVILMHMAGTPRTMQRRPSYHHVVEEVAAFLSRAARRATRSGIEPSRILLDPGLGFGKTLGHNLELMGSLSALTALGHPVVVGPSRKSFIGKTLKTPIEERLAGTLACVAQACQGGVHVVRVHDVRPAVQLIRMLEAIHAQGASGR